MNNSLQNMIQFMLNRGMNKNPVMGNAIQMAQNNDSKGLEALARNVAKERGIDVDKEIEQIRKNFGM